MGKLQEDTLANFGVLMVGLDRFPFFVGQVAGPNVCQTTCFSMVFP